MSAIQRLVQRARQVSAGREADVPSPCVSVCRVDPATQWCDGCFRTLEEIAAWSRMDDDGKREVWRTIGERALAMQVAPSSHDALSQRQREREENT
ncbi:MAG TPA: DUF1289 domain-containing protein [Ramlibacter sp.]|nr:DUF1289 domain-containing protein [Ramlibacter sp.]